MKIAVRKYAAEQGVMEALKYLNRDDVEVTVVEDAKARGFDNFSDIWE